MRAALVESLDGPSAIRVVDMPPPEADADTIIVNVRAVGLAFPDLLQTRGLYQFKPPVPYTPGSEVAGLVTDAPEGSPFSVGDRVVGLARVGGLAERAPLPIDHAFPLPADVPFERAAALPLNYLTSYFGLVERGRLAPGESVLVHGAAGGIGIAAIQIARAFGAGEIVAVTSTPEKGQIALEAGATRWVAADGFLEDVGRTSMDVVVDPVGGDRITDSLRTLRAGGRLLTIGFTAGQIPHVPLNRLLLGNLDIVGVGWGAYARGRKGEMGRQWRQLLPHVESGALRPVIGGRFSLDETAGALAALESRRATGKLVVTFPRTTPSLD